MDKKNELRSIYVKENYQYTKENLLQIFNCPNSLEIIKELKQFGIIRTYKALLSLSDIDINDEEQVISSIYENDDNISYVFKYVGIIIVNNMVIQCLPKYFDINPLLINNVESNKDNIVKKFKQVLKVLQKYNDTTNPIVNFYNNDNHDNGSVNLLAIILYLLNDYYEYGIYNNEIERIEINGNNEILWNKTINETFAIIHNNRPLYTELYTKHKEYNKFDYFKRLHEFILTECSNYLEKTKLDILFDNILPVSLSIEEQNDFGEDEYILYRISQELNNQFNTRKQLVLKAIYAFISQKKVTSKEKSLSLYGTNSFNLVWEDVCKVILNNKLNKPLEECVNNLDISYQNKKNDTLKNIIEKPIWNGLEAKESLEPDLISIKSGKFMIYDAKYYNLKCDDKLSGQPGIESITKQYLYNLAYQDFIITHNLSVYNTFLFPTDNLEIIEKGFVKLSFLENLKLENIKIIFLPCANVYEKYINNLELDLDEYLQKK